jgi:hypothetical protein
MSVAVVVVTYFSGPSAADCVERVLRADGVAEVAVVDNGSTDGSPDALAARFADDARFRLLRLQGNPGFAAACNAGAAATQSPWLAFVNPDCLVEPDAFARLVAHATREPALGLLGADVRDAGGAPEPAARRREPNLGRAALQALGLARWPSAASDVRPADAAVRAAPLTRVDACSGALMFVPRALFDALGGFDTAFRLHCEDLDLCRRVRAAGRAVAVAEDVTVRHAKGGSSRRRPLFVAWHKHRGLWRYWRKFDGRSAPWPLRALVASGIAARFALLTPALLLREIRARRR